MATWFLENVDEAHAAAPGTFLIPSLEERRAQRPGDVVRLHFVLETPADDAPRAERMWVEIASVHGDRFRGHLTNRPTAIEKLALGDIIEFGVEHIARTFIRREHPLWCPDAEKTALTSKAALREGSFVGWVFRESPMDEEDSGWRLFRGNESEQYLQDASNIAVEDLGWFVERDPSLASVFRGEHGAACERDAPSGPWRRVEDFHPPDEDE